jgi:hypothetical protein
MEVELAQGFAFIWCRATLSTDAESRKRERLWTSWWKSSAERSWPFGLALCSPSFDFDPQLDEEGRTQRARL